MADSPSAHREHAALRSESYYRLLFEHATDPIFVFAARDDGSAERLLEVNDIGCSWLRNERRQLLEPGPQVATRLGALCCPKAKGLPTVYSTVVEDRLGQPLPCEVSAHWFDLEGQPVVLSVVRNVSGREREALERRKLEQQLLHAQKLEAVARLAGGVAHDFNNLLTVILQYSSLILEELRPEDPMFADVSEIEKAGQRAATLTRQLLTFSRKSPIEPVLLNLDALVQEMERMLARILGEDVVLSTQLDSAPWEVEADRSHLEQVLANLVVNARDAMPSGGTLRIETARVDSPGTEGAVTALGPGEYLRLSVSDDGVGMAPESLEHLFEPFYTTKREGKGTGLGLATVHGIVKQAGGDIVVESELGRGSTFLIYLPRARRPRGEYRTPSRAIGKLQKAVTVLVVEDEDAVRGIAKKTLEREGHTVLEARNGGEALLISERFSGEIDAVLVDVVMPGLAGPALVQRLLQARPNVAVVYMSGHPEELLDEHGLESGQGLLLHKPFTREGLGIALQEALARRG